MRAHSKLTYGDLESMHLVLKHIRESNYEAIPQLHEVLHIKGHLGSQPLKGEIQVPFVGLPINILSDNLIQ
jgi:hypothetical protein